VFQQGGIVKRRLILIPALGLATFTAACAVSRQQAAQMGAEQAAQLNQELPIVRNATADQYVEQLGQRIVNQTPYAGQDFQFNLYRSDEVNAFASGRIPWPDWSRAGNVSELAGSWHEIARDAGHSAGRSPECERHRAGLLCVFTTACRGAGRAATT
jgi:hypothetical protein